MKSAPFQALLQHPNGSRVPGEMIATLVSGVCREGLHCLAERSHFVIDNTFGLFQHHLGGHQFHSEEVEMALCEWLQMEEPDFYNRNLNLCQVMTNASLHFTIVLKSNYTLME